MRFDASPHRLRRQRLRPLFTVLVASLVAALGVTVIGVAVVGVATPAAADPGEENGSPADLRRQLDAAAKGYLDAKARLEASQARQRELSSQLKAVEAGLAGQAAAIDELASAAYRAGGMGAFAALLDSGTPSTFLDRITLLDAIATNEDRMVRELAATRDRVAQAKAAIDTEIKRQREQFALMSQRKAQAERALRAAGGGQVTGGPGGSGSALATPARRNSNGTWPSESCSQNDPTTSGCITPRMLHALNQAKRAGFTRYVSCYRGVGSGEHPRGRACDFAAQKGGFGSTATGGDRTYGNNLAAYFVRNASRLGVLYVIWFRQIWLPGSGWRSYRGGGDPSSDHTNHVHLSVY